MARYQIAARTPFLTREGMSRTSQETGSRTLTFEQFCAMRVAIADRMLEGGNAARHLSQTMLTFDHINLLHLYKSGLYLNLIEKYAYL